MNAPVKQTLLANSVPDASRTKYMAAYGLQVRLGLLVGSLCVTISALIPAWGMAVVYALFGLAAMALYQSLFRAQDARADRVAHAVPTGRLTLSTAVSRTPFAHLPERAQQ